MDWSVLIGDYAGPLSIGWSKDDNGELIIKIRVPLGASIDVPDSIRVVATDDLDPPVAA
jgi:hypothetical protein